MSPVEVGHTRALRAIETRLARETNGQGQGPVNAQARLQAKDVERSAALDPGAPPVDAERVEAIRKAVNDGTYPIIPAQIADAVIAAGFLLRAGK